MRIDLIIKDDLRRCRDYNLSIIHPTTGLFRKTPYQPARLCYLEELCGVPGPQLLPVLAALVKAGDAYRLRLKSDNNIRISAWVAPGDPIQASAEKRSRPDRF